MSLFRTQLPTPKSTQGILDETEPDHRKVLDRADRLLAVIEDFRAMDRRVTQRRTR